MNIAIDAHPLGTHAGGNETFIRRLLEGIRAVGCSHQIVALVNPDFPEGSAVAGFPAYRLPRRSSVHRVMIGLPKVCRDVRADLLHVQYIAPPQCPCPFVVTLHDMSWLRVPDTMPTLDRWRLRTLVPSTLRRAARVFVVSQAMKTEAINLYGVPEEKVDWTPNSVDTSFRPMPEQAEMVRQKYALPASFILYVGALQPRKNLLRLAAACSMLAQKGFPHRLVIVGKRGWLHRRVDAELLPFEQAGYVRRIGYVDKDDLAPLYSAADVFAYVSLYEGFGLPVLEAMACGTPVVTSTDPALAEVAGNAAILCDPTDMDSIALALERVLTEKTLQERLRQAGLQRAQEFSITRMATAALEGYQRAFESYR